MGCIWSRDESDICRHCNRAAVNNLIVIDRQCEICLLQYRSGNQRSKVQTYRPQFGAYRCRSCKRTWNSRLTWENSYQICRKCRTRVYPYSQRELRPGDIDSNKIKGQEHPKELCQMCQQLGYYCGNRVKRSFH